MKKQNLLLLGAVSGALLLAPTIVRAGIVGSPHDFSGATWNLGPSDHNSVCGPCHQPHNANSSVVPLWAHKTANAASFAMYNTANVPNSHMKATPDANPGGVSLACLSCHDGVTAVNEYGGQVQGGTAVTITNSAAIGQNLTHTHPICFTYDSTLAGLDGYLQIPSSANILLPTDGGTFVNPGSSTIKEFLMNGGDRMECSTCHDVHNQKGTPFDINTNPKLVKIVGTQGGKGSLLCRSCHIK